ncbi:hypothetical protein GCM10010269_47870 [Streptomyces humidus]|uniref:Uncharacterized protein n=1 Tax=Streptomyces humidus TaxID=52259 RepID=A0A918FY69_9ACTN|nr:hypothetical protein [Streptomyces humidus]GGS03384.1 hypothetical protein GCM10010269_47870 [Streptomyces humidus]
MATHGTPAEKNTAHDARDDRTGRRRLVALRTVIQVLVAGCLASVGVAVRQLPAHPVLAGVYVGLASVGVAGTGVCVTLYLHLRRDGADDRADGGAAPTPGS